MASKRSTVPIDSITEDFYVRTKINDEHVLHLATLYEAGLKLPPISATREGKIVDGRHRIAALRLLSRKSIDVEWSDETDPARLLGDALLANIGGSLPPTNADIVYAMQQILSTGAPASAVQKRFEGPWPPAVVRRFISDAQSALTKSRILKAKVAVVEQGMTVGEAAIAFKLKPDTLKNAMSEKKKRRSNAAEFKGTLTGIFRSRGGSMGGLMRKVQRQLEDGDLSWSTVEQILDHAENCCKATSNSVRDWRKRFEAAKR